MTIDIIILSNARTDKLKAITQNAIDTCHDSETDIRFNVVVIEQAKGVTYQGAKTYFTKSTFNYNAFMNAGVAVTKNEYLCLCNNDLIFTKGWASNCIAAMKAHNLLSASPRCPDVNVQKVGATVKFGYRNHHELSGWCIMQHRAIYDIIGALDEVFPFWFADNVYSEQLKKHGVKHALIRNSHVKHLGNKTLHSLDAAIQGDLTVFEIERFCEAYPENESAIYYRANGYPKT
jgi:GT2 family glycosyltransferase